MQRQIYYGMYITEYILWHVYYGRFIMTDILWQIYYSRYIMADISRTTNAAISRLISAPEALDCSIRICLLQRITPSSPGISQTTLRPTWGAPRESARGIRSYTVQMAYTPSRVFRNHFGSFTVFIFRVSEGFEFKSQIPCSLLKVK